MKKILLLFFMAISFQTYSQQPFAPPGAVWQYDHWGPWGVGFIKIEYVSDTIIQNIVCKKLEHHRYTWFGQSLAIFNWPSQFVYQNADTVFWFTQNQFRILYNFNAQQGDSWVVSDSAMTTICDSSQVLVDSTGSDTINGHVLRYLDVQTVPNSALEFYGRIYERIGSIGYLFPEYADCDSNIIVDDAVFHLHCYSDSSFQVYNADTNDCDFWFDLNSKEFNNPVREILLYPNPANDYIEVISSLPLRSYSLLNHLGQVISNNLSGREQYFLRIDITELNPGFYFFETETKSGKQFMKFIKR